MKMTKPERERWYEKSLKNPKLNIETRTTCFSHCETIAQSENYEHDAYTPKMIVGVINVVCRENRPRVTAAKNPNALTSQRAFDSLVVNHGSNKS
jgi:hypothetical protein